MNNDLEVRPHNEDKDGGLSDTVKELDLSAFSVGHGHLFSPDEIAVLRQSPPGEEWDFTWRKALPTVAQRWYAFRKGELVGHLELHLSGYAQHQYAVIEPMNARVQGEHIGRQMWGTVVEALKDDARYGRYKPKGLRVWAIAANTEAVAFYRKYCNCEIDWSQKDDVFWIRANRQAAVALRYDF